MLPSLACYSGSGGEIWNGEEWRNVTKDHITGVLNEGQLRVLICTDAASEGLNLQAAAAIINYDLPWNPSKVEQRIGRIDRIGQSYPVVKVVNLFLKNSVDERVYTVLRTRCGLFQHFVGAMQPVLARARRMLMGQDDPDMDDLESAANKIQTDPLPRETYLETSAVEPSYPDASMVLSDIEDALLKLDGESGVRVRQGKKEHLFEISGLRRKKIRIGSTRETLEKYPEVRPLSPYDIDLRNLTQKLMKTGERLPLVIESSQKGAFRASIAYWVSDDKLITIQSISQLKKLISNWNGHYLAPDRWQQAIKKARRKAEKQVKSMRRRSDRLQKKALNSQIEAAKVRLKRELGRYLVSLGKGTDNLNELLSQQMSRDIASAVRLRKCIDKLGGYPDWPASHCRELMHFAAGLTEGQCMARLLGKELDAALDDPRWIAKDYT